MFRPVSAPELSQLPKPKTSPRSTRNRLGILCYGEKDSEPLPPGFYAFIQVEEEKGVPKIYTKKLVKKESGHDFMFGKFNDNDDTVLTGAGELFVDPDGEIFAWSPHTGSYHERFYDGKSTETIKKSVAIPETAFYCSYKQWEIALHPEKQFKDTPTPFTPLTWAPTPTENPSATPYVELYDNGLLTPGTRFITVAEKFALIINSFRGEQEELIISSKQRARFDRKAPLKISSPSKRPAKKTSHAHTASTDSSAATVNRAGIPSKSASSPLAPKTG